MVNAHAIAAGITWKIPKMNEATIVLKTIFIFPSSDPMINRRNMISSNNGPIITDVNIMMMIQAGDTPATSSATSGESFSGKK